MPEVLLHYIMTAQEKLSGVPGMLRPFKAFIESLKEGSGTQIIFYGVPGTCTPFVELLCYAVRSLPYRFVFVPFVDEKKAVLLGERKDVGFQATETEPVSNPAALVIMGGLAMPQIPVSAGQVKDVLKTHPNIPTIGICFMSMFEKEGWLSEIAFDSLIDADISVTVTR